MYGLDWRTTSTSRVVSRQATVTWSSGPLTPYLHLGAWNPIDGRAMISGFRQLWRSLFTSGWPPYQTVRAVIPADNRQANRLARAAGMAQVPLRDDETRYRPPGDAIAWEIRSTRR